MHLQATVVLAVLLFASSPTEGRQLLLSWRPPTNGAISLAERIIRVGDEVVFNFKDRTSVVVYTSQEDWKQCNVAGARILNQEPGPYGHTFYNAGSFFFSSGNSSQCAAGLKVKITVRDPTVPSTPVVSATTTQVVSPQPSAAVSSSRPTVAAPVAVNNGGVTQNGSATVAWQVPSTPNQQLVPSAPIHTLGTLTFTYTGSETVARFRVKDDYDKCNVERATGLHNAAAPYRHTFTSTGTYYFASSDINKCRAGQKVTVLVTARPNLTATTTNPPKAAISTPPQPAAGSAAPPPGLPPADVNGHIFIPIPWINPDPNAPPPLTVLPDLLVNDAVVFDYGGELHDVYLFPNRKDYDDCNFANATLIGGPDDSPYTLVLRESITYYIGCSIPLHCTRDKMKLTVTVRNGERPPGPIPARPFSVPRKTTAQAQPPPPPVASARPIKTITVARPPTTTTRRPVVTTPPPPPPPAPLKLAPALQDTTTDIVLGGDGLANDAVGTQSETIVVLSG